MFYVPFLAEFFFYTKLQQGDHKCALTILFSGPFPKLGRVAVTIYTKKIHISKSNSVKLLSGGGVFISFLF